MLPAPSTISARSYNLLAAHSFFSIPLLCTSHPAASPSFLPSIIPSLLPGLVDIYLEHSHFPMVLHVALCVSVRADLWPTSISVTCQDLWVMESKRDRSESVFLKPTSGLLWDIMDDNLYLRPLLLPCRLSFFHPASHTPLHSSLHPTAPPAICPALCSISHLDMIIHFTLMEIW